MKRIPRPGTRVRMTSSKFMGEGVVVDVFSRGEAAVITIRDDRGRCWSGCKEEMHKLESRPWAAYQEEELKRERNQNHD